MAARAKKSRSTRAAKRPKRSSRPASGSRVPRKREAIAREGMTRPSPRPETRRVERTNWSKVKAPGRGDVDRHLYERSTTFKRRQAAAKKGQKNRAALLQIELEKKWARLKELKALGRGDLARRGFKKFAEVRDAIGKISKDLQKKIMIQVNRDVGGARGAWRDYGKGAKKK